MSNWRLAFLLQVSLCCATSNVSEVRAFSFFPHGAVGSCVTPWKKQCWAAREACWTVQGLQCLLWQLSFRGSFIIKDVLAVEVVALDAVGGYFLKLLGMDGETKWVLLLSQEDVNLLRHILSLSSFSFPVTCLFLLLVLHIILKCSLYWNEGIVLCKGGEACLPLRCTCTYPYRHHLSHLGSLGVCFLAVLK